MASDAQTSCSFWWQIFFLLDLHMTLAFPRKDQNFMESHSASHVFGKQRKALFVDKFYHITSSSTVCLSKQKFWMGARKPQCWSFIPTHMFLHMKDSSLWKGLLTGANKLHSLYGSLFNIQNGGSIGSIGRSRCHLFFAQQLWCVETHRHTPHP